MAQSSAQRDPSMEEILASIRKIIEEGEESRQKPADLRDDFEATPIGPAANDAMRRPLPPAPELRTTIPQVEPPESKAPVAAQRPEHVDVQDLDDAVAAAEAAINELSLSLDDFVIDLDDGHDYVAVEEVSHTIDLQAAPVAQEHQHVADGASHNAPKLADSGEVKSAQSSEAPEVAVVKSATPPAASVEAGTSQTKVFVTPQSQVPKAVVSAVVAGSAKANGPLVAGASSSPATQPDQKSAMLSQSVERQVAASFSELSEALAASRRRPLDQIAEEMMRPMLQEWLDDNLPTLVERLVREEIERVARGAS